MEKLNISSWHTWKKNNVAQIYSCRDSQKGWARETINPTLQMCGFICIANDYDYGFKNKTKHWATEEAQLYLTQYKKRIENCEFVYFCNHGKNGYMDYRAIYVRYNGNCNQEGNRS